VLTNGICNCNGVTPRRARLVLRWVTVRGFIILVYNHQLRSTQPPNLSGIGNMYRPRDSASVLRLGR